jgi:hypothetical protein
MTKRTRRPDISCPGLKRIETGGKFPTTFGCGEPAAIAKSVFLLEIVDDKELTVKTDMAEWLLFLLALGEQLWIPS